MEGNQRHIENNGETGILTLTMAYYTAVALLLRMLASFPVSTAIFIFAMFQHAIKKLVVETGNEAVHVCLPHLHTMR